jgi:uncharacterized cupredoxin-like copper-binding protein
MPIAELILQELSCIKGNEQTDEVYFILKIEYTNRNDVIMDRYPSGKPEHIQMRAGDIIRNTQLYIGDGDGGITITLTVKEQDTRGVLSNMRVLDDTIGSVVLHSEAGQPLHARPGKHATVVVHDEDSANFELTGAHALYRGRVVLTNK